MPATYEPIATYTASGTTYNMQFTSIPQTYSDLVLIGVAQYAVSGSVYTGDFRVNNASTGYYETTLFGNGATVTSGAYVNDSKFYLTNITATSVTPFVFYRLIFLDYTNTTLAKTVLIELSADRSGAGNVERSIGMLNNTSAITSIQLDPFSVGMSSGTTYTLYGIKRA